MSPETLKEEVKVELQDTKTEETKKPEKKKKAAERLADMLVRR